MGPMAGILNLTLAVALLGSQHHGDLAEAGDNPKLGTLKTVTISKVLFKGSFPKQIRGTSDLKSMNVMLRVDEWIPGRNYVQLREVYKNFTHDFLLKGHGQSLPVTLLSTNMDGITPSGHYSYLGAHIEAADFAKLVRGRAYEFAPVANGATYRWRIAPGLKVRLP